jgi:hypothetical protein
MPDGKYLNDTLNWMKVSGSYTAKGTEKYITLGNFIDFNNTNTQQQAPCNSPPCGAYYYIDDVSIVAIDAKANAGKDTIIHLGDNAFIGTHQGYRIKNLAVYQDIRDSTLHLI